MVFKNCKVYLVFVFFFYKVVEKLNLNIVYVVDREKDGVRIFFFDFVNLVFIYFILRVKKVFFLYF